MKRSNTETDLGYDDCDIVVTRQPMSAEDIRGLVYQVAELSVQAQWPMDRRPKSTAENDFLVLCENAYELAWEALG